MKTKTKTKTKIIDRRQTHSKRNTEARAEELRKIQEATDAFVRERFPNAKRNPVTDDRGTVVAQVTEIDVSDRYTLMELMRVQYPGLHTEQYVEMTNAVFQKEEFKPSEAVTNAIKNMTIGWFKVYAHSPVSKFRENIDTMRSYLNEVGYHVVLDLAQYGYPARQKEAALCARAISETTIINTFLNALVHDKEATDEEFEEVRDYITLMLEGEKPTILHQKYLWINGEDPRPMRDVMLREGRFDPFAFDNIEAGTQVDKVELNDAPPRLAAWLITVFEAVAAPDADPN